MVHTTKSMGGGKKMTSTDDPMGVVCKDAEGRAYIKIVKPEVKEEKVIQTKTLQVAKKKKAKTKSIKVEIKNKNPLYQRDEE